MNLITNFYRYVKYGKQVGEASKAGITKYQRGKKSYTLDKNGNILTKTSVKKTGKNSWERTVERSIPYSEAKEVNRAIIHFSENQELYYFNRFRTDRRVVYNKPEFVQFRKDLSNGKCSTCIDTPRLDKNCHEFNERKEIDSVRSVKNIF